MRALPSALILIVTDSPLGKFFRSGPVQDFVKLPTIVKKSPGEWVPVGSSLSFDHTHHVRRETLLALKRSPWSLRQPSEACGRSTTAVIHSTLLV